MALRTDGPEESKRILILLAIWVIYILVTGINKAIGVMLPVLLEQLDASTRITGVAVSLVLFTGYVIGKCLFLLHVAMFHQH